MKRLRELLEKAAHAKGLRRFAAIFETLDGIVFGSRELTAGAPHLVDNIEIKRFMTVAIIALPPSAVSAVIFWG